MLFSRRLHLNLLNIEILFTLNVVLGDHPNILKKLDYLQIEMVKVNPKTNRNIIVPTVCAL